jgi:hypothetical protein
MAEVIVKCNKCGREYTEPDDIELARTIKKKYGEAPCSLISCSGTLEEILIESYGERTTRMCSGVTKESILRDATKQP